MSEQPGGRTVTIRDVAKLAGVSVGTVSNLLSGKKAVSPATQARVEEVIRELKFVPNSGARVMQGARSHTIALMVPDTTNPFFVDVARGIEDVTFAEQHVVVVCNTEGLEAREEHYATALSEMRVRGVIAVASSTGDAALQRLEDAGAEVVRLGGLGDPNTPSVGVDDELGGWLAGAHLIELGHKHIWFVGGPGAEPQIRDRMAGAKRAIAELAPGDVSLDRADVPGSSTAARLRGASGIVAALHIPVAVFCANDQIAAAVETVALRAGLRIPEDIAIVGYDDTEASELAAIPVTTIRQPGVEIGREAARLILQGHLAKPADHILFAPELVVRQSTSGSVRDHA